MALWVPNGGQGRTEHDVRRAPDEDGEFSRPFRAGDTPALYSESHEQVDTRAAKVLTLDEVSYDRDVRWMNAPADSRPRATVRTSGAGARLFGAASGALRNTSEFLEFS